MGITYVFPDNYDMNTIVHINSYDHWGSGINKSLSQIVSQIKADTGATFNALLISPSNNNGTYGGYYFFLFNLSADPLYTLSGPWPDATGSSPVFIETACGISGIPASGMGYAWASNDQFFAWHGANIGETRTYNNRSYTYASGYASYHSILILIDYEGKVYCNDENKSPTLDWFSIEQLSGNNNQFRLDLSQIKEDYIYDGITTRTTQDNDLFIINPVTSLKRMAANFQYDVEEKVVFCGNNYMTLMKHKSGNDEALRVKLYYQTDYMFYDTGYLYLFDTLDDYYLCFIQSHSEHKARLDLIHYYKSNDAYWWSYNEGTKPSDNDFLNTYVWLEVNGFYRDNPYDIGTTDDGGDPGLPRIQDHIYTSPLPTKSGLGLGFISLYHPTPEQLSDIADLLWSNTLEDNIIKYFNNFADNIIALYVLPYVPGSLSTKFFSIGNYTSEIDNIEYVTTRYYDIPMGTVDIGPFWDSYLDFEPYTKCYVYLPYIGIKELDIDELMCPTNHEGKLPSAKGCTLSLLYRLDILTGIIVAQLKVTNEYLSDEVRYQFSGKVGYNIPLTGQTYNNIMSSMLNVMTASATAVMTGGLTAPLVGAAAIAGTVQAQKPSVERVGELSGDTSMMGQKTPYLIIESPNKPYIDLQEDLTGFPSYKSDLLENFTGYTEVVEVHAEGFVCTEDEREEIIRLLKEGVLL